MIFHVKNQLLSFPQYGFGPKKSCNDSINHVTKFMRAKIDPEYTGRACFVDLQKVYDTLDHEIVFTELSYYGFRGHNIELLASYLSIRKQYIRWSGIYFSKQKVITGVPQWSDLWPFSLLLHKNDLEKGIEGSHLAMFADDATTIVKC